jgi:hypothetical protein
MPRRAAAVLTEEALHGVLACRVEYTFDRQRACRTACIDPAAPMPPSVSSIDLSVAPIVALIASTAAFWYGNFSSLPRALRSLDIRSGRKPCFFLDLVIQGRALPQL